MGDEGLRLRALLRRLGHRRFPRFGCKQQGRTFVSKVRPCCLSGRCYRLTPSGSSGASNFCRSHSALSCG